MQKNESRFIEFLHSIRVAVVSSARQRPLAALVFCLALASSLVFWSQLSALHQEGQIVWIVGTIGVIVALVYALLHAWLLVTIRQFAEHFDLSLTESDEKSLRSLLKAVFDAFQKERQVNDVMLKRFESERFRIESMESCLNGFSFEIRVTQDEHIELHHLSAQISRFFRASPQTISENWHVLLAEIEPEYHAQLQNVLSCRVGEPEQQSVIFKTRRVLAGAVAYLQLTVKKQGDQLPINAFAVCRDVTSLVGAKEKAEQADRSKSDFLATISHELRTPLNAIVGFSRLLHEQVQDDAMKTDLEVITSSGENLHLILNDILDYSRIQADGIKFESRGFDLNETLSELYRLNLNVAKQKGLEFRFENEMVDQPFLRGDAHRLRQIVQNLLSNALKFTDQGFVTLKVQSVGTHDGLCEFFIEVADSGIGISQINLRNVFDRFSQGDRSIHRKFGGSGLGLAICKGLVEMMGGRIDVTSEPAVGSVFTVSLVLPYATRVENDSTKVVSSAKGAIDVLVVDDHPLNRKLLDKFLGSRGHRVDQAEGGAQSVSMAIEKRYDLILMDIDMPEIDGYEATRQIRDSGGESSGAFICALSGLSDQQSVQNSIASGMNRHLTKPVSFDEVEGIVAMLNDRKAITESAKGSGVT